MRDRLIENEDQVGRAREVAAGATRRPGDRALRRLEAVVDELRGDALRKRGSEEIVAGGLRSQLYRTKSTSVAACCITSHKQ